MGYSFALIAFAFAGLNTPAQLTKVDLAYLEMSQDSELGRIENDYAPIRGSIFHQDVAIDASANCIKIQTRDGRDFRRAAKIAYLASLQIPVQICNESLKYNSDSGCWVVQRWAACIADGMIYPQTKSTADYLQADVVFRLMQFSGCVQNKDSVRLVERLPSILDGHGDLVVIESDTDWWLSYLYDLDATMLETVTLTTVGGDDVACYKLPD